MTDLDSETQPRHRNKSSTKTSFKSSSTKPATRVTKPEQLPLSLIFPYIFLLRLFNALTIYTFFQPDEYYQSLEPAHWRHYGYGILTWEWRIGLRSYLHPLIYDLGWYIIDLLQMLGLFESQIEEDNQLGIWIMPRLINALIVTFGEVCLYRLVYLWTKNENVARLTLACSVASVWNWYISTRSFGNSLEMSLTCMALRYWPWDSHSRINWTHLRLSLVLSCACCIIRPTNALIWVVLGLALLYRVDLEKKFQIIINVLVIAFVCLLLNTVVDFWFYGEFTFPLWNFLKFNALTPLAEFYGKNDWHFHLFQSIPIILMLFSPFFIIGFLTESYITLKLVIITNVILFSCISHKEFRFLYPLHPFFLFFTALGLRRFQMYFYNHFKSIFTTIIIINTLLSYYLTQIHERGVIDVINYLQEESYDIQSVGFLTPCHSTPMQSQLHTNNFPIWSLSCEPPLQLLDTSITATSEEIRQQLDTYQDESDLFYSSPQTWLYQNLPPFPFSINSHPYHRYKDLRTPGREYKYEWPSHLIFFQALEPELKKYLNGSLYVECERFENTKWHWDGRRSGDVIVWCLPHYY